MPRQIVDPRPPIPAPYRTDERVAIQEMARDFVGFFGIMVPEKYEGLGLGVFEYALITEELSRAWMSVASIIARSGMAAALDPSQKAKYYPLAARGEWLGSFAMSEPDAGSDIASIRTRADKVDGGWLLNGQKMWCTFADQSDGILVVARTTPYDPERRHSGIRRFILHKAPGEFPDGCTGNPIRKIGYHGWNTYDLSFNDCFVANDGLLGLTVPRIHTAARSIGLARGALEDSVAYVQEREQFGRPIGDFQVTRFKIAKMAAEVEPTWAAMTTPPRPIWTAQWSSTSQPKWPSGSRQKRYKSTAAPDTPPTSRSSGTGVMPDSRKSSKVRARSCCVWCPTACCPRPHCDKPPLREDVR